MTALDGRPIELKRAWLPVVFFFVGSSRIWFVLLVFAQSSKFFHMVYFCLRCCLCWLMWVPFKITPGARRAGGMLGLVPR